MLSRTGLLGRYVDRELHGRHAVRHGDVRGSNTECFEAWVEDRASIGATCGERKDCRVSDGCGPESLCVGRQGAGPCGLGPEPPGPVRRGA